MEINDSSLTGGPILLLQDGLLSEFEERCESYQMTDIPVVVIRKSACR